MTASLCWLRRWLSGLTSSLIRGATEFANGISYKQYLIDDLGNQRGAKPVSVIDGIYTQHGTADLTTLFGDPPVIQFPKPVALMKTLISMGTEPDSGEMVLDFFAGSGSLAQATLELNRGDGGNRRFIMVQLPEPVSVETPARNAGFATISDIGKERTRRVIARMAAERQGRLDLGEASEDLGFRVFKLARSSWRQWQPLPAETAAAEYAQALELFHDPLVGAWKPEDVIYELMLREGYSLTSRVEPVERVADAMIGQVTDVDKGQSFYICLDVELRLDAIKPLGLRREDLFICRDIALDDTVAANLSLQCRLKTI